MAATDQYLTVPELRAALGHPFSVEDDALLVTAIGAASRQIDEWAGGTRQFWTGLPNSPRLFHPVNHYVVDVGYFASTVEVVVETDDDADGVFETAWMTAQWRPDPLVTSNGRPYEWLVATTATRLFPVNGRRPCVRVTAPWGWAAVPAAIRQACQILSIVYYKSKDFTGGSIGFGDADRNDPTSPVGMARTLVLDTVRGSQPVETG